MSFDAGTILGHLQLDKSGFAAGMLEANGLTQLLGGSISSFMANPLLGVANVAKQAVSGISGLVEHTASAAVEFGRLAETTGASVHFLSGVSYACQQVDLPADQAAESFSQLVRGIRQAASGTGPAADAFRELGINVRDANGQLRPTEQVFMEVADGMGRMNNSTQKAAVAQEIFGRAGTRLLPILSQGRVGINGMIAEADRLGVTMNGASVQAAEKFHSSLIKIEASFQGLANKTILPIIEALAPVFSSLAESLGSVLGPILQQVGGIFQEFAPIIGQLVQSIGQALLPVLTAVFDVFKALMPAIEPLLALVGDLARLIGNVLGPVLEAVTPILRVVAEIVGAIANVIGAVVGGIADIFSDAPAASARAGSRAGQAGSTVVNVQVSPEDSARRVADKVSPAIVRGVQGVQGAVERSTQRELDRRDYQRQLGVI